jgi:mannose-6-phosphate isomerase-like protein (cupin superfamily)
MTRRSSPRPDYDRATAIRYDEAVLHLWGDQESGYVGDRIYASSSLIHLIEFSLRPRARFVHSDDNRTIFAADEVLYVAEGEMLMVNPQTGEAAVAREGESVFFRRDTWHHAVNLSNDRPLRVMELFAPPPSTGASSTYARTKPYLSRSQWRYADDRWLGKWPMSRADREETRCFQVIGERDLLWRVDNPACDLLVGMICSTEHLTAGLATLLPGQKSMGRRHGGDLVLVVVEGEMAVFLPDQADPPSWFELGVGDGFYVPKGVRYQLFGHRGGGEILFGTAPAYLGEG